MLSARLVRLMSQVKPEKGGVWSKPLTTMAAGARFALGGQSPKPSLGPTVNLKVKVLARFARATYVTT
jgi:hypothetical protein